MSQCGLGKISAEGSATITLVTTSTVAGTVNHHSDCRLAMKKAGVLIFTLA
jgi:hypothetical protein